MKNKLNILSVIPARGGSKGIPRKNVRLLNGKPLISYVIDNAKNSKFDMDIVVSTDDKEIKRIALLKGITVVDRSDSLADDVTTLDPVIYDAYEKISELTGKTYDLIITLQATSPLLTSDTLDGAIEKIISNSKIDTLISAVNDPHLAWTETNDGFTPKYEARINRQFLPKHLSETGAFLITRQNIITPETRIGQHVSVHEIPDKEAVDIDIPQDWWVAETELSKKNILIRVEGYSEIGLGHVYRGLSLAYGLIHHNIHFVISEKSDLAIHKVKESFFPHTVIADELEMIHLIREMDIDIVVNDMLNTSYEYIKNLKSEKVRVVNFEDLGEGAEIADAVINDLYAPIRSGSHYFWGSHYYILRDEFITSSPIEVKDEIENVLVIFGGVDPSNLTQKVFDSLPLITENQSIHFDFIVGPGYKYFKELKKEADASGFDITVTQNVSDMSYFMSKSDLALSSQGRTMLELASMGVPTILIAQNERELTHEFGELTNGYINLGLGEEINAQSIASTINWLVDTPQIREQMHKQMTHHDLKNGLDRVLKILLN